MNPSSAPPPLSSKQRNLLLLRQLESNAREELSGLNPLYAAAHGAGHWQLASVAWDLGLDGALIAPPAMPLP